MMKIQKALFSTAKNIPHDFFGTTPVDDSKALWVLIRLKNELDSHIF